MATTAKGTFDTTINEPPSYDRDDGAVLGRTLIEKRFDGDLSAISTVEMLSAGSATVKGSAGYVALERVTGTLGGQTGTFVLQHSGIMNRGAASLSVTVVPDTGSGGLVGIRGTMSIDVVGGAHVYSFDYDFDPPPSSL
jgi:hypothetical protein